MGFYPFCGTGVAIRVYIDGDQLKSEVMAGDAEGTGTEMRIKDFITWFRVLRYAPFVKCHGLLRRVDAFFVQFLITLLDVPLGDRFAL